LELWENPEFGNKKIPLPKNEVAVSSLGKGRNTSLGFQSNLTHFARIKSY